MNPHRNLLYDIDQFFYGTFADQVTNFLRAQFLSRRQPIRAWFTISLEFTRENEDGIQQIRAPFNQPVLYIPEVGDIGKLVSDMISNLLEKIFLFTESGSNWSLETVLLVEVNLLFLGHQFNAIGRSRDFNLAQLFGCNSSYHVGQDNSVILPRILFTFCDSTSLCFPISLGASCYDLDSLPCLSTATSTQIATLRREFLDLAYSRFEFSDITSYPCSFEAIRSFAKRNEDRLLLNVVGLTRKKSTVETRRRHKIWPIFQTGDFLKQSLTGQKQVVHLVITAEIEAGDNESNRYHVSLVRDFQELMKAVKGRQNKHFYCPTCLAGIDRP